MRNTALSGGMLRLIEVINARMEESPKTGAKRRIGLPKGQGPVMLMLHLKDIRADIEAGHTARAIFVRLADRLGGMSYRQFATYIRRLNENPDVNTIAALRPRRAKAASTLPPPAPMQALPAQHPAVTPAQPSQENHDGPKAPPRPEPRRFIRRAGLPDDNKDYLLGPPGDSHDVAAQGRRR
jgi:hypothetical protein